MSLLTVCIGMSLRSPYALLDFGGPYAFAFRALWSCLAGVSMRRKNACSCCSKDTHRVCDCGVDAMPILNTDDPVGSSLICRPSTLPGKTLSPCSSVASDEAV